METLRRILPPSTSTRQVFLENAANLFVAALTYAGSRSRSAISTGPSTTSEQNSEQRVALTDTEKEGILIDVYSTAAYSQEALRTAEDVWVRGSNGIKTLRMWEDAGAIVTFSGMQSVPYERLGSWGLSEFQFEPKRMVTGEEYLVITVGSYESAHIEKTYPQEVVAMNIKHEAIVTYAVLLGIVRTFKIRGIDLAKPFDQQARERKMSYQSAIALFNEVLPFLEVHAEAIAELRDYLLLFPVVEKNDDGNPLLGVFEFKEGIRSAHPFVNRIPLGDGGLFDMVDEIIGPHVREFPDIPDMQKRYADFRQIPLWGIYEDRIEHYFTTQR